MSGTQDRFAASVKALILARVNTPGDREGIQSLAEALGLEIAKVTLAANQAIQECGQESAESALRVFAATMFRIAEIFAVQGSEAKGLLELGKAGRGTSSTTWN